jgi:hypothetical protein
MKIILKYYSSVLNILCFMGMSKDIFKHLKHKFVTKSLLVTLAAPQGKIFWCQPWHRTKLYVQKK